MTDPGLTGDEALLAELERVLATADPPPVALHPAARAAFGLGRLAEELAELVAADPFELAGARGDGAARLLTFRSGELEIDVQVTVGGATLEVTGLVGGPGADEVAWLAVQTPDTSQEVAVDAHGRFRASGLVGRMLRLALRCTSGTTVATSWVLVG